VAEYLDQMNPRTQGVEAPTALEKRQEDLARTIMELPEAYRVAFVAWSEAERSIVVGTMDGGDVSGIPKQFQGTRVSMRQATRAERETYYRWKDKFDAP